MILSGWALAGFSTAEAVPVTFDLAGAPRSSVVTTTSECSPRRVCGVEAEINASLDSVVWTMEVGDSFDFHFLTLEYLGPGFGRGTIHATLAFDATDPSSVGAAGAGGSVTFLGAITGGLLKWDDFSPITLEDGTSFLVSMEDLAGIDMRTANVRGTITRIDSTLLVSEPAPLVLLGLGLMGLVTVLRLRKASAAN
jgi:hypothetical protein